MRRGHVDTSSAPVSEARSTACGHRYDSCRGRRAAVSTGLEHPPGRCEVRPQLRRHAPDPPEAHDSAEPRWQDHRLTARVPCPPELTVILRAHLQDHVGEAANARLFVGVRGGDLPAITYRRAWREARREVFGDQQYASLPLARRPYDLRHACVSTWLNGGVPPPRWPSGLATAWTCSCGSTLGAWRGRMRSPSDGSPRR